MNLLVQFPENCNHSVYLLEVVAAPSLTVESENFPESPRILEVPEIPERLLRKSPRIMKIHEIPRSPKLTYSNGHISRPEASS